MAPDPRIANLWPNYEPTLGADFYAGYDLIMPYWWPHDAPAASSLRTANPYEKILRTQNATYGWPELDELTGQWWDAEPGDWGYPCLFRDSGGEILLVRRWEHPMYNLIWPECRATLVQRNLEEFLSPDAEAGDDLAYDGIFWDLLKDSISWLGEDIDSDLDGRPDDAAQLDAAYQLAMKDFLEQIRDRLPNAILMGNETSTAYAPWVNGRMFEWQLWTLLDGGSSLTWDEILAAYDEWSEIGRVPRTTFIQGAPLSLVGPDGNRKYDPMAPAMKAEAAADYRRMRFGLTTALMSDGLYFFQYEPTRGQSWWYDEFGAYGGQQDARPRRMATSAIPAASRNCSSTSFRRRPRSRMATSATDWRDGVSGSTRAQGPPPPYRSTRPAGRTVRRRLLSRFNRPAYPGPCCSISAASKQPRTVPTRSRSGRAANSRARCAPKSPCRVPPALNTALTPQPRSRRSGADTC